MGRRGKLIIQEGRERRLKLAQLIKQAAHYRAVWEIWDDLIYMSAAAISQPLQWIQAREDEYLRRIGKYDKKTQDMFPEMFAAIVNALEQEGHADVLGSIYMQLELGNHWKGQFFTPYNVSLCMARMNATNVAAEVEAKGFITVNDPCCGGGAMLIAFAQACKEQDVNYQNSVLFVAQDIDPVVARMCYVQMSLLGMPGKVIIGNSLTNEPGDYWFTPFYYLSGFAWRRQNGDPPHDEPTLEIPESANDIIPAADDFEFYAAKQGSLF